MTLRSWLYLVLAIIGLPLAVTFFSAYVEAMDCYGPEDKDRVNHCLALLKDNPVYCSKIKDGDRMNFCTAQVTESDATCSAIKAPEMLQECVGMLKELG
jgi:hypothetical protein